MRKAWDGPMVVKGVHTGDAARQAVDAGADAVLSNHGGRQLDGVPASIRALPELVEAAGGLPYQKPLRESLSRFCGCGADGGRVRRVRERVFR